MQAEMAHQSKQMRVGAHEGFVYYTAKLVSLANSNRYEVDSITFLEVVKSSILSKYCPVSTLTFLDTHLYQQSVQISTATTSHIFYTPYLSL
jgi:hypothetical protein